MNSSPPSEPDPEKEHAEIIDEWEGLAKEHKEANTPTREIIEARFRDLQKNVRALNSILNSPDAVAPNEVVTVAAEPDRLREGELLDAGWKKCSDLTPPESAERARLPIKWVTTIIDGVQYCRRKPNFSRSEAQWAQDRASAAAASAAYAAADAHIAAPGRYAEPIRIRAARGGGSKTMKRSSSRKLKTRRSSKRRQNATRRLRARVSRR